MMINAVRVKALHYAAMADAGWQSYNGPATEFRALHQRLHEDETFRDNYIHNVKSATGDFPFWWEEARLPEEPI
jgi:hypothetical protein